MCDRSHGDEYASRMLADNMIVLHKLSAPGCSSIHVYACADHFHIGHRKSSKGEACKAANPFRRPPQPGRRRR